MKGKFNAHIPSSYISEINFLEIILKIVYFLSCFLYLYCSKQYEHPFVDLLDLDNIY